MAAIEPGIVTRLQCFACLGESVQFYRPVSFLENLTDLRYGALCGQSAYPLYRCSDCELTFVHPMPPSTEQLREAYEFVDFNRNPPKGELERLQRDLDIFSLYREPGRLLDIGIGNGMFLKLGEQQGWEVHGLEINRKEIEHARDVLDVSNLREGTIEQADYPESFFDAVHMSQVLEHLASPRSALLKVREWLKPGGVLLLSVPNIDCFYHRLILDLLGEKSFLAPRDMLPNNLWTPPFHLIYFNPRNLRMLMEGCGLTILQDHSREMTGLWAQHEDSVGPRVTEARIYGLCREIWKDRSLNPDERFRKYYPALRALFLQAMGWAAAQYMDEVEVALDSMNCICFAARKA